MSDASFLARLLPKPGQSRAWWRMPASASALAWTLARVARQHDAPVLAVTRDNQSAHQLEQDLRTLIGRDDRVPVLHFPDWETLPYDQFSPHPDIVSQPPAALHRLPPPRWIAANAVDLRRGGNRCISEATGTTRMPRLVVGSRYRAAARCETMSGCGLNRS